MNDKYIFFDRAKINLWKIAFTLVSIVLWCDYKETSQNGLEVAKAGQIGIIANWHNFWGGGGHGGWLAWWLIGMMTDRYLRDQ